MSRGLGDVYKRQAIEGAEWIPPDARDRGWNSALEEHVFGRVFRERLTCRGCYRVVEKFEWAKSLLLKWSERRRDIVNGVLRLETLIEWHVQEVERLNDARCDDGLCARCQDGSRPRVQHELHRTPVRDPSVLVVHLGRGLTRRVGQGVVYSKDHTPVVFPKELSGLAAGSSARYRFAGAVFHQGENPHSGHYYAYCDVGDDQYARFDDDLLPRLQTWAALANDGVLRREAYVLVYVRLDTQPVGSASDAGCAGSGAPAGAGGSAAGSGAGSSYGVAGGKRRRTVGAAATQAAGASAPAQRPAVGAGRKRKAADGPTGAGPASASTSAAPQPQPQPLPPASSGQESERRSFTPRDIDRAKCMSRTWGDGAGAQCTKRPADGCDGLCKMHFAQQGKSGWHGRVDGPIPDAKLKEFQRASNRKFSSAGQAADCAQSGGVTRPVPAPPAAERCDAGADGSGGAPPARSIVDGCVVVTSGGSVATSEAGARPEARPRNATLGIPDVAAHEAAQAAMEGQTARRRRDDFTRGRVTGFSGDIPRSDPSRWG